MEHHHEQTMQKLKEAQKAFAEPHPIVKKLIALFEKLIPKDSRDKANGKAKSDKLETPESASATEEQEPEAQMPESHPDVKGATEEKPAQRKQRITEEAQARVAAKSMDAVTALVLHTATTHAQNTLRKAFAAPKQAKLVVPRHASPARPQLIIQSGLLSKSGQKISASTRAPDKAERIREELSGAVRPDAPFVVPLDRG
jgi:hypothetical protein